MNNGLTSFDNLIAAVQDETGITNLRNHLPMVRRLVTRAENEINPYGTLLIKKKMIHYQLLYYCRDSKSKISLLLS